MSVSNEMRMEWQRMMTRTRNLDTHLKEIFTVGMDTPDGGKFGGKGFRSTWQEGLCCCCNSIEEEPNKRGRLTIRRRFCRSND